MSDIAKQNHNRLPTNTVVSCFPIEFSGTTCDGSPWSRDWLVFSESEYYHRVRRIMLKNGMGSGDVEMILANVWEDAWIRGNKFEQ